MLDAVLRLWCWTKFIKRFRSFRRSLGFSVYCSIWLTTQISWSGYLKSTIGFRWCLARDCFNNSGMKRITLSASKIIKFIFNNVWSHRPVIIHRRISRLFKLHYLKAWRSFMYLRRTDIFHGVECLGITGLKLKTTFKNLHTKDNFPNNTYSKFWL